MLIHSQGISKFIAFFDECGDHSLEKIDPDFPIFILSTVIVERESYISTITPAVTRLKMKYWDHEGINLHSREIRKKHGPFNILEAKDVREAFIEDISSLMEELPYTLFLTAIDKNKHKHRYGTEAWNPYEFSLSLTFERILCFMKQNGEAHLPVIAESRGENEDRDLEAAFYRLMSKGTGFMGPEKFRDLICPILFQKKRKNICGLQLADLCAYPAARHILNPEKKNRAFDVVKKKIFCAENGRVNGWKVFP